MTDQYRQPSPYSTREQAQARIRELKAELARLQAPAEPEDTEPDEV